jgi:hypothetical protein
MKKLDTGGAASSAAPKATNGHAKIEVGERLEKLISQFIVVNPEYKKFKAQHETLSRDIGGETRLLYFDHFAGLTPETSTMIAFVNGREVKLIVKNQYDQNLTNDEPLIAALGKETVDANFHWRTKYTVDFDNVPEDKQEAFAKAIEEARTTLELAATAVVSKQFIEPNAGFHEARTTLLTKEQNQKLDALLPVRSNPVLA